jgi:hypothetical protein
VPELPAEVVGLLADELLDELPDEPVVADGADADEPVEELEPEDSVGAGVVVVPSEPAPVLVPPVVDPLARVVPPPRLVW